MKLLSEVSLTTLYQCWFLNTDKCTIVISDVGKQERGERSISELRVLPLQTELIMVTYASFCQVPWL